MATAKPPSGRKIWEAIQAEMEDNLYRLPFSTLAPAVYHVYLHPDDFSTIEGVVSRVVAQAQRGLNEDVQRKNDRLQKQRRSALGRILPATADRDMAPIEVPPGGWEIYIQPDRDGHLPQGHMGIVSRLALPAKPEYEGGAPTTRIVKTVIGDGTRTRTTTEVEEPVSTSAVSSGHAYARMTYEDDGGSHTFVMRKDEISVGRGGTSAWVDVTLVTGAKVSREHFRLRRDRGGRFFIRDLSTWGTWLNGEKVPPAVRTPDGVTQPGPEREVPPASRIDLAQAVNIDFKAEPQP